MRAHGRAGRDVTWVTTAIRRPDTCGRESVLRRLVQAHDFALAEIDGTGLGATDGNIANRREPIDRSRRCPR